MAKPLTRNRLTPAPTTTPQNAANRPRFSVQRPGHPVETLHTTEAQQVIPASVRASLIHRVAIHGGPEYAWPSIVGGAIPSTYHYSSTRPTNLTVDLYIAE